MALTLGMRNWAAPFIETFRRGPITLRSRATAGTSINRQTLLGGRARALHQSRIFTELGDRPRPRKDGRTGHVLCSADPPPDSAHRDRTEFFLTAAAERPADQARN